MTGISRLLMAASLLASVSGQTLSRLNIDRDKISVSGFSGGAYFATQFHAAFSATVSGVATWSGGPNLCLADEFCTSDPSRIDVGTLVMETERLAASGDVDATSNMMDDRVYVFQGSRDQIVNPASAPKIKEYYDNFMAVPAAQIVLVDDIPASHAVVSDYYGTACGSSDYFLYVENCGYDSAYNMLNHLHGGDLTFPSSMPSLANLHYFDQDEFFDGDAYAANMGPSGLVFVPPACEGLALCGLHVHFHGCGMYLENVGTDFVRTAGFADTAELNDIVVLFPQVTSTTFGSDSGCFNWYGYLDDRQDFDFAKKNARQMRGLFGMVQRLAGLEGSTKS